MSLHNKVIDDLVIQRWKILFRHRRFLHKTEEVSTFQYGPPYIAAVIIYYYVLQVKLKTKESENKNKNYISPATCFQ